MLADPKVSPSIGGFRIELTISAVNSGQKSSYSQALLRAKEVLELAPSGQLSSLIDFYGAAGLHATQVERGEAAAVGQTSTLASLRSWLDDLQEQFQVTAKQIPVDYYRDLLSKALKATFPKNFLAVGSLSPNAPASDQKRSWLLGFYNLLGLFGWGISAG